MHKCDRCGKGVEHIHHCSVCTKKVCISCSRLWHGKRFCLDCLARMYLPPVREPPKKPIEAPKPSQEVNYATIGVLALTIVILFIAGSLFMERLGEHETMVAVDGGEPEVPKAPTVEMPEGADFKTSQISYMKNLVEFKSQSAECFNGKLDKLQLVVEAHVKDGVYIRSVELNDQVAEDWMVNLARNKIPEGVEATITIKVPASLQMKKGEAVPVKVFAMGDSGVYQQTRFVPDLSAC